MADRIFSVSEVNDIIKRTLDRVPVLHNVQVLGEISNFKRSDRGHCYFNLKDKTAILKCVIFGNKISKLRFDPKNGDTVIAIGDLSVYKQNGIYQLYTDLLIKQGIGDLMLAYAELRNKLEREGLFSLEHKRPLPMNPKRIGIVTSPYGAAIRDIITVSRRRNPGIKLYIYPVKVQGEGAAEQIAQGIKFFNKHKLVEVLIVGRGGGSIEDLWAFNEEITVRAVAASKIPVVSAVGHEIDYTLCDFAADRRAATPSQAAEIVVADVKGHQRQINNLTKHFYGLMQELLDKKLHHLLLISESPAFKHPESIYVNCDLRVDKARQKLTENMTKKLQKSKQSFIITSTCLESLSPLAVIKRGYSLTKKTGDSIVSSIKNVKWGDELCTIVKDGNIISVVQQVERSKGSEENT